MHNFPLFVPSGEISEPKFSLVTPIDLAGSQVYMKGFVAAAVLGGCAANADT